MSARIRYLCFLSDDPRPLADFYARQFGFSELSASAGGDVSLTDGAFHIAFLKRRNELKEPHMDLGLNHIGIAVENLDSALQSYRALYPVHTIYEEPGDGYHGEVRIYDPECNPVSLSQKDFGLPPGNAVRTPRISHIALNALNPEVVRDFYEKLFGFRELFDAHALSRSRPGYRNKHVGDGHVNVAIQSYYSEDEGRERRFGVAHFGLLVNDSKATADRVVEGGATVKARPAIRTQAEIRMRDPQGNGCDLSQRGWEVDHGEWSKPIGS